MCGHATATRAFDTAQAPAAPDGLSADDFPELKEAFIAWKAGNFEAMVEESLKVLGITVRSANAPPGLVGWTVTVDSAALYVSFDRARGEVVAEAPVVWVPEHQRVGLMRALLELNLWALQVARFCLNGDVVVLRFADRVQNVSPPKLLLAVREVGREADRHDNWLAERFGARMVGPEAQRASFDWSFIGTAVELRAFDQAPVGTAPSAAGASVEGLLTMLDTATRLLEAHDASRAGLVARLVCRSLVYRAWADFKRTSPTAATLVLDGGWAVAASPLGHEEAAPETLAWLENLRGLGAGIDGLAPAPSPELPELEVGVAAYVAGLLGQVQALPLDPELQMFVLLGGLAELLTRAPIPTEVANRLKYASVWAGRAGASPDSCAQIVNVLRGLVA